MVNYTVIIWRNMSMVIRGEEGDETQIPPASKGKDAGSIRRKLLYADC